MVYEISQIDHFDPTDVCMDVIPKLLELRGKTLQINHYDFEALMNHPMFSPVTYNIASHQIATGVTTWLEEVDKVKEEEQLDFKMTLLGVKFIVVK